jgi:hypothetical protein
VKPTALLPLLFVTACASGPPVPDWQADAHSAMERATDAWLSGEARAHELSMR